MHMACRKMVERCHRTPARNTESLCQLSSSALYIQLLISMCWSTRLTAAQRPDVSVTL